MPIVVGSRPEWLAITPDGKFAYVVNRLSKTISVIDTQTRQVVGPTDRGRRIPNRDRDHPRRQVRLCRQRRIEQCLGDRFHTNQVVGSPISVGSGPFGVAITPDQPPRASLSSPPRFGSGFRLPQRCRFDGRRRVDRAVRLGLRGRPVVAERGDIAKSRVHGPWDLQGNRHPDRRRGLLHGADLHRADRPLQRICGGESGPDGDRRLSRHSGQVSESAKPGSCRFALQAVTKKKKGKAETAVARVR